LVNWFKVSSGYPYQLNKSLSGFTAAESKDEVRIYIWLVRSGYGEFWRRNSGETL
jgi:hypothetical protein